MKVPFASKCEESLTIYPTIYKLFHKQYHLTPTYLNNLVNKTNQTRNLKHATQIHNQIITNGYLSLPFLFNNLLNLYSKCGHVNQTILLFSTAHHVSKNIVTWTSLITQLSHFNKHFEALTYFNQMRSNGIYPNDFTFSSILTACGNSMIVVNGGQMQSLIHKHGFHNDVFVNSSLIDMYAKCGDVTLAKRVFDEMPERNLVSWNSMIAGSSQNKMYDMAIGIFWEANREEFINPDQVSFSSVLSASANIGKLEFGRQIHGMVVKRGFITLPYVRNSLMDLYFKCGLFNDAALLFQCIEDRDIIAWNVMITGCVHSDKFEEAYNYFSVMRRESVFPDEASYSKVLHACAGLAALNQGALVHDHIIKTGFTKNFFIASSLITMYAKCGSLVDASLVFEEIENHNVVCWTAMIAAYQQHGCADQVIGLFEEMLREGIKPDYITFVCVLSACGYTRNVEEGYALQFHERGSWY